MIIISITNYRLVLVDMSQVAFHPTRIALVVALTCGQISTAVAEGSAAPAAPLVMPEVVITDAMGVLDDGLITQSRAASVGKSSAAIQDTPFAMSIIDVEQIRETGAKNIQEALVYSSGVYAGRYGFDTRGDWAAIRGLSPSNYIDGLRSGFGSYNNVRPEIYSLESLEVLKGPSSALYGQAELGGIVNVVTKKPSSTASKEVEMQLGSHGRKQLALDLTGPVSKDQKFLYRLVALKRDSDTQVDYVNDDAELLAPSLTWRPNENTSITAQYTYQKNDSKVSSQFLPSKGTIDPAPLGQIPSSRFMGEPDWDRYDTDKNEFSLIWDQRISDSWKVVSNLRQTNSSSETREIYAQVGPVPDDAGNIGRTVYAADRETDVFAADFRFEGSFKLGATKHNVAVGVDHQNALWEEFNYTNTKPTLAANGVDDFNLYSPVYGSAGMMNYLSTLTTVDRNDNKIVQTGVYVMDHMEWGPWVVSAAVRNDRAQNELLKVVGSNDVVKNSATTGRAGLMYRLDNGVSPYISWSSAFSPNLGTDGTPGAGFLKPTTGEQTEAGVKYLSHSGRTSATLAWFDIEQQNRVIDGATPGGSEQVGAVIKGWEAEVRQRVGPLEIMANYTDFDAKNEATGHRLSAIAEKTASAWGQYYFASGLRAGLGARYIGDVVGSNSAPQIPSVTLYDAMVGYTTGPWDVRLDARNLADKTYVSWCRGASLDCGYGEQLSANLTTRYRF